MLSSYREKSKQTAKVHIFFQIKGKAMKKLPISTKNGVFLAKKFAKREKKSNFANKNASQAMLMDNGERASSHGE